MSDELYPRYEMPSLIPHVPNVTTAICPSELAAPPLLAAVRGCGNCKHCGTWPGSEPCIDCNELYPEKDGHQNVSCRWEAARPA